MAGKIQDTLKRLFKGKSIQDKIKDLHERVELFDEAEQYEEALKFALQAYDLSLQHLGEEHPDVGRRFMVAYLKGVRQYNQGKTPRNIELIVKLSGLDRDIVQEACWPALRNDGDIHIESVLDFQNWLFARGALDKVIPAEQFWDSRFVDHANQVLTPTAK